MGTFTNDGLAAARDGITAAWNAGAGTPLPALIFKTAADAVIATITMQNPPAGAASSGGSVNLNPPNGETDWLGSGSGYEFTASGTGTVAKCVLDDGSANVLEELTVGTSGTDVIVNTTSWVTGNTYRVTATPSLTTSNPA